MIEVKLSKSQATGYRFIVERIQMAEQALNMVKQQANDFLSDVVIEAGHTPSPKWKLNQKTLTLYLPGTDGDGIQT